MVVYKATCLGYDCTSFSVFINGGFEENKTRFSSETFAREQARGRDDCFMNERALLLYDATCRFCDSGSKSVLKFLPSGTIERADVNDPVIQRKYGISREAAQREMYLVNRKGQVSHGIWAVGELLKLSRWAWPLAWLWHVPGFTYAGQKIYLWIADHRYMIMGRSYKGQLSMSESNDCKDGACSIHLGQSKKSKERLSADAHDHV